VEVPLLVPDSRGSRGHIFPRDGRVMHAGLIAPATVRPKNYPGGLVRSPASPSTLERRRLTRGRSGRAVALRAS
jgi:hypothetical protein